MNNVIKVRLLWNYKEKFMQLSTNFERISPIKDSIQSISNIRFQVFLLLLEIINFKIA